MTGSTAQPQVGRTALSWALVRMPGRLRAPPHRLSNFSLTLSWICSPFPNAGTVEIRKRLRHSVQMIARKEELLLTGWEKDHRLKLQVSNISKHRVSEALIVTFSLVRLGQFGLELARYKYFRGEGPNSPLVEGREQMAFLAWCIGRQWKSLYGIIVRKRKTTFWVV